MMRRKDAAIKEQLQLGFVMHSIFDLIIKIQLQLSLYTPETSG